MDFEKALDNPAATFGKPDDVLSDKDLSREQKIEVLQRWEHDARLLQVAEEESMEGSPDDLLTQIRQALHALGFWPDTERSGPSKVGGSK